MPHHLGHKKHVKPTQKPLASRALCWWAGPGSAVPGVTRWRAAEGKEELPAVPMPLTVSPPAAGFHQVPVTLAAGAVESGAFGPSL